MLTLSYRIPFRQSFVLLAGFEPAPPSYLGLSAVMVGKRLSHRSSVVHVQSANYEFYLVRGCFGRGINNGSFPCRRSNDHPFYMVIVFPLIWLLVTPSASPWAKVGLARRKVIYYKRLVCSELSDFFSDFFCVKSLFEMSLPFLEETCGV